MHEDLIKTRQERDELLAVALRLQSWGRMNGPDTDSLANIIHDTNEAITKAQGGEG